jgi:hypothetical protein
MVVVGWNNSVPGEWLPSSEHCGRKLFMKMKASQLQSSKMLEILQGLENLFHGLSHSVNITHYKNLLMEREQLEISQNLLPLAGSPLTDSGKKETVDGCCESAK